MKKILFILFLGFCFLASGQIHISSSSQNSFQLRTKKLGTFYVTKIEQNNNGKKSEKCIINGNNIDCGLISKCKKGNCDELENYLIKNKVLKVSGSTNNQKKKNSNNNTKAVSGNQLYIKATTNKRNIVIGEQILVSYKLFTRIDLHNTELSSLPALNGFWAKDLKTSSRFKRDVVDGVAYNVATIKKSVLTAQKSGELVIDPMELKCSIRIQNKRSNRNLFFGGNYQVQEELIRSEPIKITVTDLPRPPANFNGAVGDMSLKSEVDNRSISANDAITYKITITGTGNIELIKPLAIQFPEDFEVYDPKITDRIFEGGRKRSVKTFEYLLIPRYKGEYTIPSTNLIIYNPKSKKYETKKSNSHKLSIGASKNNEDETNGTNQQTVKSTQQDINYIFTNTTFQEIGERAMSKKVFYTLFFLPIVLLLLLWIYIKTAGKTDTNSKDWKNKKSNKIALKRLKTAQKCIKNNDFDGFFEEIEKSLWGYFADKFKIQIAELSKETISIHFNSSAINIEIESQFIALLDECEFARYAPASNKNAQMDKILEKAKNIIIEVETALK